MTTTYRNSLLNRSALVHGDVVEMSEHVCGWHRRTGSSLDSGRSGLSIFPFPGVTNHLLSHVANRPAYASAILVFEVSFLRISKALIIAITKVLSARPFTTIGLIGSSIVTERNISMEDRFHMRYIYYLLNRSSQNGLDPKTLVIAIIKALEILRKKTSKTKIADAYAGRLAKLLRKFEDDNTMSSLKRNGWT
jgi:hypothetical protein